ncbi:MAG: M20/M25/M40 family metallo-hydrolase [Mariniblastus sp.]|nr:M20/M25/M40 family metallo-hydrolase [Mariniblastus sp.]
MVPDQPDRQEENGLLPDVHGNRGSGNGFPLLISLLVLAFIPVIAFLLGQPPGPVPADAAADRFSAERAIGFLEDLVSDNLPHPAGTEQNRVVREKIIRRLRSFGYVVQRQETEAQLLRKRTSGDPQVIPLCNVMARLDGAGEGPAIMLVTHFDSVPYGPGASDDGVGVAAMLEVARMLKTRGPPERPVILLFTDGEEYGLLGAKKFVEDHPWAGDVGWAINLEARGTKGPSILFETGSESLSLVREFSQVSRRPIASSLFYEIYKLLPNDTDFTIFKKHGMQGFNFAFIGDVKNYHTPDDSLANVHMGSFQHHGENMWGLVSRLAYLEAMPQPGGQAVYFDVLGRWLLWWPAYWSIGMTVAAGLVWLIVAWTSFCREEVSFQTFGFAAGSFLLFSLCLWLAGSLCDLGLRRDGQLDNPWPINPLPIVLSFWLVGLVTASALSLGLARFSTTTGCWLMVWLAWWVAALLTSLYLPGASYLFVLPVLVAVVSQMILGHWWKCSLGVVSAFTVVVVGLLWLPMEALFYDAIGFRLNQVLIIRVVVLMTVIWPLLDWTRPKVVGWILVTSSILLVGCLLAGFLS